MALAINGTPGGHVDNSGTATTVAASVTTTVADTIVIAVISAYHIQSGGTAKTVTGVSGGGLTWARRSAQSIPTTNGSILVSTEVWWAHATGALTAQSITATFDSAPNQRSEMMVFGVSGSNHLSAPWDVNGGLPATTHSTGTGLTNPSASITTTSTSSMLLGFLAYAKNGNADNTVGSGFSNILTGVTDNSLGGIWEQKAAAASGAQTVNFTGNQQFWVLAADALNGDAATGNTGTISTALTKASLSAAGKETFTGTAATHLTKALLSAVGKETFPGTINTALTKASLSAAGKETFTGTVTTDLSGVSQSVHGFVGNADVTGSIETDLTGLVISALAVEKYVGTITTRLTRASFAAVAEEDFVAAIHTRLGGEKGQIIANVVQAEEIIEGPIVMNLSPFNSTILGAKLGTPGDGKWYSYRSLDS